MRICVVEKYYHNGSQAKVPDEYVASDDLKPDCYYEKYIKANGPHFTSFLAEWASGLMKNANRVEHVWIVSTFKKDAQAIGVEFGNNWPDATYAANMAYADFYPYSVKDEAACIRYAYDLIYDPDGYEGQVFYRWLTDMKHKGVDIDWKLFL